MEVETETELVNNSENIENEIVSVKENYLNNFNLIFDTINTIKTQVSLVQKQLKQLEREVKKENKDMLKQIEKVKGKKRKNISGFAKPSSISDDLCLFMNKQIGTQVARTEVTRYIINYIKENSLESKENKKIIVPDEKLRKLLQIKIDEELTYFTIQKFMNKHFIK